MAPVLFENFTNTIPKRELFTIRQGFRNYKETSDARPQLEKKWWQGAYSFTYIFLGSSSMHGFRQLTAPNRHWAEYTMWCCFIALAIFQTINQSLMSWHRYQNYPTVAAIERGYQAWNTSLAAIVLCPDIKIDQDKLDRYVNGNFPDTDRETVKKFLTMLANFEYKNMEEIGATNISSKIKAGKYMEIINELKPDFRFQSKALSQREMMYKYTILETGICAAFNSEIAGYTSPELFFSKNLEGHPNASFNVIFGNPLEGDLVTVILDISAEFHAQLSGPNDIPDSAIKEWEGKEKSYNSLELTTMAITCSEEIRSLSLRQRKCRFKEESNLTISHVYSYTLCRMDCRRQLAIKLCKCSPHFYKKIKGTRTCDIVGLKCLAKHKAYLIKLRDPETEQKVQCHCLPTCEDMSYVVDQFSVRSWWLGTNLKYGIYTFPKTRVRREVIFGVPDLVEDPGISRQWIINSVSIGATAGLFLGCSVLSFVEIIYFITLRLFFYIQTRQRMKRGIEREKY